MKNLRAIIFGIMAVLLMLIIENNTVKAVCSPPPNDLGGVVGEWSDIECCDLEVNINGIICTYHVCYYWRTPGITSLELELYVCNDYQAQEPCDHDQIATGHDIQMYLAEQIMKQNCNQNLWLCPPCPIQNPNFRVWLGACVDYNNYPPTYCPNPTAFCKQEYTFCCDNFGQRILTPVGDTETVGACTGGCTVRCEN